VTVSGIAAGAREGVNVTAQIIKPGKYTGENNVENLTPLDYETFLQKKSGGGGAYSFTTGIFSESGVYTVRVTDASSGGGVIVREFEFYLSADIEIFLSFLSAAKTAEEVKRFFEQNPPKISAMGFYSADFENLSNKSLVYREIADFINRNSALTSANLGKAVTEFRKAVAVSMLNETISGDPEYVFREYFDDLGISEYVSYSAYESGFVNINYKPAVRKSLTGLNIAAISDFESLFNEKAVLIAMLNLNSWNDAFRVLSVHSSLMPGLDLVKYNLLNDKSVPLKAVAYGTFQNLTALKDAFNASVDAQYRTQSVSKQGGGSGTAGVSSGGGSFFVPNPEQIDNSGNTNPENTGGNFGDLKESHWAYAAVESLAARGIVNGTGDGLFDPDGGVTREQFITMLVRGMNFPEENSGIPFDDVLPEAWYYPYVMSGVKHNITNGQSSNIFGAGNYINREDLAVMCFRAAKAAGMELNGIDDGTFSDGDSISLYALEAVKAMKTAGIIQGMGDGRFEPGGGATRAQSAMIIYNILKYGGMV
jgi:hypothetical protein